ncbi:ATP-dependent zinc metalloprotease FtsH [Benzoatithermus flavus]|uniref:ATP-dependent zinc metalloprotease FtsH n=1 Tax=Benzoatithermus flavus TaxID=3108223 RepID=A0ABU8XTC3_9PROT
MPDPRGRNGFDGFLRYLAVFFVCVILGMVAANTLFPAASAPTFETVPYSRLHAEIESEHVLEATIEGSKVRAILDNGQRIVATAPDDATLIPRLLRIGAVVTVAEPGIDLLGIVLTWLPALLLAGVMVWIYQRTHGAVARPQSRRPTMRATNVRFDDVAGIDEVKAELSELVDYLKDPSRFAAIGAKIPRGVLLAGSPGVGKTLIARAVAGEAGVPFFAASGAEFVEMFVGVGAKRVRELFAQAKKVAPAIVFIDEIDAVGRRRSASGTGSNDEREQTLNQILVEMDGFEGTGGVIVIAATNRPDVLDPALLRPGRFDRRIDVPLPDLAGRFRILQLYAAKVRLSRLVDLFMVARATPGFSGADLANVMNEAALAAARAGRVAVEPHDLQHAIDRSIMGLARRSLVMSEEERRLTAYHEAGHALTAALLPDSDPIHKATIVPHGSALGMVVRLPERDRISVSRRKLEADLIVAMAGRAAEEIVFGEDAVTAGAAGDIDQATRLVRKMITEWGMDEEIGLVRAVETDHRTGEPIPLGEETRRAIDRRVKEKIARAYEEAKAMLLARRDLLDELSQALLERETIPGQEIMAMVHAPRATSIAA